MGPGDHPFWKKEISLKIFFMKTWLSKPLFKKYGRKALIIYLCWCAVKGVAFLLLGFKLFG
jgi:hypothetical protein